MTAPPRGIDREQGYVTTGSKSSWWQVWEDEPTPELQWPLSIQVYDRMRRQDPQVQSVLRAVTYPVQQTQWRVDPAGASDEVTEFVADNLGLPIKGADETGRRPMPRERGRFSWEQHLEDALEMVTFGHSVFEQVARITVENGRQWARLHKLAPRWQKTIRKFNVARDGGLESIEQWPLPGEPTAPVLDINRLVVYAWERQGGAWTGRSMLRSAYKPWLLKDQNWLSWTLGVDRNSMGVPVFTDGPDNSYLDEGTKLATGFRSGSSSGAGLPNGSKLELLGVDGTLIDPEKAVRYSDEQIARSVLAHALNLGQATGTGSYALGASFIDLFMGSLNKLGKSVASTATQHVVEDLVDWNFGESEPAPKITFSPIGQNELAIVQAVKTLIEAGAIFPDPKLDAFVRDVVGLPPRAPFERRTSEGDDA